MLQFFQALSVSDIFCGIIGSLLATLIFLAAGFARKALHNRKNIAARRFWNPDNSNRATIVLGFSHFTSSEVEPQVNLRDSLTAFEIKKHIEPFYHRVDITSRIDTLPPDQNTIIIGGPLVNSTLRKLHEDLQFKIWFLDVGSKDKRTIGTQDHSMLYPSAAQDDETILDYGLLTKIRPPQNPQKFITIFAGAYGAGTYASAHTAISNVALADSVAWDQEFQMVTSCRADAYSVNQTQIITGPLPPFA